MSPAASPRRSWLLGSAGLLLAPAAAQAQPLRLRLLGGELPPLSAPTGGLLAWRVAQVAQGAGFRGEPQWLPWARAFMEARSRGHALLFPVARTPERERDWQWLALLAHDEAVLWVRRDALAALDDGPRLRRLQVGVLRDSMHRQQLQRDGFTQLDIAPSEAANARKLGVGRIQAWAAARSVADYWLDIARVDRRLLHPPLRFGLLSLYLAATLDVEAEQLSRWRAAADRS